MKATIPYIERKFEEFNRQMFAGKLPPIPIELSNAKSFLGQCVCKKRKLPFGKFKLYDFRLRISTRFDLTEQEVEDTIIHEMIHYYIGVNNIKDTSAHGEVFRQIMNTINEKYGRKLSISHRGTKEQNEAAYDSRPRWHVVAIVDFKNGKTGLKVLPRVLHRILNYYNIVGANETVEAISLYMSNDIFFNRFPNSGALTATFVDKAIVMEHLAGAETLQCDGTRIIRGTNSRTWS